MNKMENIFIVLQSRNFKDLKSATRLIYSETMSIHENCYLVLLQSCNFREYKGIQWKSNYILNLKGLRATVKRNKTREKKECVINLLTLIQASLKSTRVFLLVLTNLI